ncbi:MAG TPA: hypothetical protein DFR83_10190, partial [Deltaproteobacteria bacterium]|nr:hypothetical protein [Deltaproteobacteria bacterium]
MPNTAQLAELESLLETLVALVKETEALETLLVERLDRFHAAERASEELGAESFDSADFDFDIEDIYSFDESFAGGTPESPVTGALSSDDVEPAVPEPVAATVDPDPAAQGSDPVPATDGAPSTRASVSSASGAPSPRDSVSSASGDPS